MQKIIVTGAQGFVGSRLVKRLEEQGHEVISIDAKSGGGLLYCTLPKNVDVIFHLAAHKSVEESWQSPLLYTENLLMTQRLVHEYPNALIIHGSSCAGDWPVSSPYGFMKFAASKYLEAFHKNYIDLVFPNIFGGQQKFNSVVDIFKNAEKVRVDDPKIVRDYVHVDDIVDGLIKSILWRPGRYSMGSNTGTTTLSIAQATGKEITYGYPRSGGKEPLISIVQNTTPDWEPTIDVLEYVKG